MIVGFRILCRFLFFVNVPGEERVSDVYKNMPLECLYRKGFSAPSSVQPSLISKSFPNYLLSSYQGLLSQ